MSLPQDIRAFLAHYQGRDDDSGASNNLLFYQNQLRCQPDNLLISEILQKYAPPLFSPLWGEIMYRHLETPTAGATIISSWSTIMDTFNGCESNNGAP